MSEILSILSKTLESVTQSFVKDFKEIDSKGSPLVFVFTNKIPEFFVNHVTSEEKNVAIIREFDEFVNLSNNPHIEDEYTSIEAAISIDSYSESESESDGESEDSDSEYRMLSEPLYFKDLLFDKKSSYRQDREYQLTSYYKKRRINKVNGKLCLCGHLIFSYCFRNSFDIETFYRWIAGCKTLGEEFKNHETIDIRIQNIVLLPLECSSELPRELYNHLGDPKFMFDVVREAESRVGLYPIKCERSEILEIEKILKFYLFNKLWNPCPLWFVKVIFFSDSIELGKLYNIIESIRNFEETRNRSISEIDKNINKCFLQRVNAFKIIFSYYCTLYRLCLDFDHFRKKKDKERDEHIRKINAMLDENSENSEIEEEEEEIVAESEEEYWRRIMNEWKETCSFEVEIHKTFSYTSEFNDFLFGTISNLLKNERKVIGVVHYCFKLRKTLFQYIQNLEDRNNQFSGDLVLEVPISIIKLKRNLGHENFQRKGYFLRFLGLELYDFMIREYKFVKNHLTREASLKRLSTNEDMRILGFDNYDCKEFSYWRDCYYSKIWPIDGHKKKAIRRIMDIFHNYSSLGEKKIKNRSRNRKSEIEEGEENKNIPNYLFWYIQYLERNKVDEVDFPEIRKEITEFVDAKEHREFKDLEKSLYSLLYYVNQQDKIEVFQEDDREDII